MAYLLYYQKEHKRWPQLGRATFEEAVEAIKLWSKQHDVPPLKVERTSGNRNNHFRVRTWTIRLNMDGGVLWSTVAHEFAHAWHSRLKSKRGEYGGTWHNSEHAELVDILCRQIVKGLPVEVSQKLAMVEDRKRTRAADRIAAQPPEFAVRIAKREEQIKRLSTKIKGLTTRLKKAQRSLAALRRNHPEVST